MPFGFNLPPLPKPPSTTPPKLTPPAFTQQKAQTDIFKEKAKNLFGATKTQLNDLKRAGEKALSGAQATEQEVVSTNYALTNMPIVKVEKFSQLQNLLVGRWDSTQPYYFSYFLDANSKTTTKQIDQTTGSLSNLFRDSIIKLDIPPSAINISIPFAVNVSATNGGILEEHNGVVFRHISISGSTGVWPAKTNAGAKPPKGGILGNSTPAKVVSALFPSAVSGLEKLVGQAKKTYAAVVGGENKNAPSIPAARLNETGYFQFWNLHHFLIAYAEAKKDKRYRNIRLVFGSVKDNIEYVVAPVSFQLRRDASSPLLYRYDITLKCYDIRKDAKNLPSKDLNLPTPDNVNAIKSVANVLRQARKTIRDAKVTLSAVQSDAAEIMNVFTQVGLVVKDTAGLVREVRDFPTEISNNVSTLFSGAINRFKEALNTISDLGKSKKKVTIQDQEDGPDPSLDYSSNTQQTSGNLSDLVNIQNQIAGGGATSAAVVSGSGATNQIGAAKTQGGEDRPKISSTNTEAKTALSQAMDNNDFLDKNIEDLDLPDSVMQQIDQSTEDAKTNTTAGTVRDLNNKLQEMSNNLTNDVGLADTTFSSIYNSPSKAPTRSATENDIILSAAIQDSKVAFTSMLATGQIFRERDPDPYTIANENLDEDEKMTTPSSALPAVFERGGSLESMAAKYLGDANRAREIAILNNLRAPYIDEVGFNKNITGAFERAFVMAGREDIEYGQLIRIGGTGVASTTRRIMNIEDIGGDQYRVTVNGPANLDLYAPATSPYIWTRRAGTVGSNDIVLIPNADVPEQDPVRPTSVNQALTQAEKVFQIDLALNEAGTDLEVTPAGDINLATGYKNAEQAIRLALEVERGELDQHPTYGLSTDVGLPNTVVTFDTVKQKIEEQLMLDDRFSYVDANVAMVGNTVRVNVNAAGILGSGIVPLEFDTGTLPT